MVLNLYSNGYSAALGETLVREAFGLGSIGRAMPVQSAPCGSLTGPLPAADGHVGAVLDIDSTTLATFDSTDALWLEKICRLI